MIASRPFGRTVLCHSDEGGQKWTNPRVVNDSPLDDREAGIASLGKNQLLLSWFSSDPRDSIDGVQWPLADAEQRERWNAGYARMVERVGDNRSGSYSPRPMVRYFYKPIVYSFWGKYVSFVESFARGEGAVASMRSTDGGRSWALGGTVPLIPNTVEA